MPTSALAGWRPGIAHPQRSGLRVWGLGFRVAHGEEPRIQGVRLKGPKEFFRKTALPWIERGSDGILPGFMAEWRTTCWWLIRSVV